MFLSTQTSSTFWATNDPPATQADTQAAFGADKVKNGLDRLFRASEAVIDPLLDCNLLRSSQGALDVIATTVKGLLTDTPKPDRKGLVIAAALALRWTLAVDMARPLPRDATRNSLNRLSHDLLNLCAERKIVVSGPELDLLIQSASLVTERLQCCLISIARAVGESLLALQSPPVLSEGAQRALPTLQAIQQDNAFSARDRARLGAIDQVCSLYVSTPLFHPTVNWAVSANALTSNLAVADETHFRSLLRAGATCNPSKPTKDWLAQIDNLLAQPSTPSSLERILRLFEIISATDSGLAHDPRMTTPPEGPDFWRQDSQNKYRLIGLACAAGRSGDAAVQHALVRCVSTLGRLPADWRFQQESFAAACVRGLSLSPKPNLTLLHSVNLRIKWPPIRKLAAKLLAEGSTRLGISLQEAEEMMVPTYDLVEGSAVVPVGAASATIQIVDTVKPMVTWKKPDGSLAKTSATVKSLDPASFATLQEKLKGIESILPAQRTRLELLLRDTRTWNHPEWLERYGNHGLIAPLARRLIWTFDGVPAVLQSGRLLDMHGVVVSPSNTTAVRIWHPIGQPVSEVLAWRRRLEELGLTQPFKQAHREVYLLTAAEERTDTYSNRFAAHIVKSGTLIAIGQTRRWKVSLYGHATLDLPQFGIRAEYWSHPAGDTTTFHGGPEYLSTDQLRFYRTGETSPMQLSDVPPLPFSEAMRDCDLFVGIASVANNPNWADGGPQGAERQYQTYWHDYTFGDLTASAQTRRDVLTKLLPRMTKLQGKWELDPPGGRFLKVQGIFRKYKIHLGSGNILMEPNDQYLCIVPDSRARSAATPDYLPFEGDNVLSIILSKALLLAEDAKITDPTITRQIALH